MGPVAMGVVSLILNSSAPRRQLGKVNGFAGSTSNLARAGTPIVGGALIAGMVCTRRGRRSTRRTTGVSSLTCQTFNAVM